MAGYAPGGRELADQPAQSLGVLADVGVYFGITPLHIEVRDHGRAAVSGSCNIKYFGPSMANETIQMYVDQGQPRAGSPVAQ